MKLDVSMGDSTAMTIEFLRARLLTERSVSKAAKQRSDELTKRVLELEEQLKLVSLQRKKAEKAITNVLSILESNGVADLLEEFDSGSELDETLSKSNINNNLSKEEECSVCSKTLNDDSDGSEDVASPLSSRSLSWKSCRASLTSHEKCIDSSTRKRGKGHYRPVVPSSSRRRVGKSRRQIQRKEIRSAAVDDSQINGNMSCPESDKSKSEVNDEDDESEEEEDDDDNYPKKDNSEEDDDDDIEVAKREKVSLREMEKLKSSRSKKILDDQNATIDAYMNTKGKGRLKYLLQQTELFAHFAKGDQSQSKKKSKGRGRHASKITEEEEDEEYLEEKRRGTKIKREEQAVPPSVLTLTDLLRLRRLQNLCNDVLAVLKALYGDSPPAIVFIGHMQNCSQNSK